MTQTLLCKRLSRLEIEKTGKSSVHESIIFQESRRFTLIGAIGSVFGIMRIERKFGKLGK